MRDAKNITHISKKVPALEQIFCVIQDTSKNNPERHIFRIRWLQQAIGHTVHAQLLQASLGITTYKQKTQSNALITIKIKFTTFFPVFCSHVD